MRKAFCIWLTGLSGAGKTTIAVSLKEKLGKLHVPTVLIDGDDIRKGLNQNLGFTEEGRKENIRRVSEVCKLILESNISVICAFISPSEQIRKVAKEGVGRSQFIEVYVNTPINECIKRDPKGLYSRSL